MSVPSTKEFIRDLVVFATLSYAGSTIPTLHLARPTHCAPYQAVMVP